MIVQGLSIEPGEIVLAQSQPDGETYVLSTLGICGPLNYTEWRDEATHQPRADWADLDYNFVPVYEDDYESPADGWRVIATQQA